MNAKTKGKLKAAIAELEEIYAGELKATKRHKSAGNDDYSVHAAWCADGIQEALMLLENGFKSEAVSLLRLVADSSPTDDLRSHKKSAKAAKLTDLPQVCAEGGCNHVEHL